MSDPTADLICDGCPHYEMADEPELDEYDRATWHHVCTKKRGETCPKEQEWRELADFARQTGGQRDAIHDKDGRKAVRAIGSCRGHA